MSIEKYMLKSSMIKKYVDEEGAYMHRGSFVDN